MFYSSLEIINSTNYSISGEISYMTVFCNDVDFTVQPNYTWKSEKRLCPIVEILAFVITENGVFLAKPFISMGTMHDSFEIVQNGDCNFRVIKMKRVKEKATPQLLQATI